MPWSIRIRGELHNVEDKPTITVGRSEECDIQVLSRSVDQRHVEMVYVPEKKAHFVKDLRSVNGTFINERRLPSGGSMEIKVLDIVKLGYDIGVLRIEELPTKLPSQRTEDSTLPTHGGVPSATTPVSASYVCSPTLPQHAQGMPVQFIAFQPLHQSPTHAPLLPAAPGVSYLPMAYCMPVGTGGMSGVPVDPSTIQQASTLQPTYSHFAQMPAVSGAPSLQSDQALLQHHSNYPSTSTHSGIALQPTQPPAQHAQERLFHPVNPTPSNSHFHGTSAIHRLKQGAKDSSMVGELTMALIDLDSDTETGAASTRVMQLAPQEVQRGRMPNFDSDVSSNFTSVSNQEENVLARPVVNFSSLQRKDGQRTVDTRKSPSLSQSSSPQPPPDTWWAAQMEHQVRSRSSSTNSEDVLGPNRHQRPHVKRGKRAGSSATYEVRSTDDGFSAGDEGSDLNIDNRTTIVSRTEARPDDVTITLPEVASERPDTAQTLTASDGLPSPMSTALDETDNSLRPPSASSDVIPQEDVGRRNTPPGSSVEGVQQSVVGGMTSWNITFDSENESQPKGRRSMPALTSITKRLTPTSKTETKSKKTEAKSRKSFSPATGASKVTKNNTAKRTQSVSSKSPLHSLVSSRRQVDTKMATSSGSALKGVEPTAVKRAGPSPAGRRTPQNQTGARKEVVTKSVGVTAVKNAQKKGVTKTETTVSGKGQRSSSPFTRNTSDRRTYTKKDGASTPDLPHISAEQNKKTPSSKQTTPKSHGSHVTGKKRGSALPQTPLAKEQRSAKKGESGKEASTTVLLVDAEHAKERPATLDLDEPTTDDLSPRKVVGEEDAGGTTSDCKMGLDAEGEGPGEATSVPSGVDSLIVAAHFGEADCRSHSEGRGPHEGLNNQARLSGVGGSALFGDGVMTVGQAGGECKPTGISSGALQTPPPNLSTPAFGPATSSPKDGTAPLTEGLSPLALELEDTPTCPTPATGNHTEVKGRVSSARRQWQKSKTHGLEGLVLASMGALSEQVSRMAGTSLDQLASLRTDLQAHGALPAVEGWSDATYSFEIEGSDEPPAWMASHQELAQVFCHLQETEKKLKELNQLLTVMSKRTQHPEELTAVSPAGDPQEPFREEQDSHSTSVVHNMEDSALENGRGQRSQ